MPRRKEPAPSAPTGGSRFVGVTFADFSMTLDSMAGVLNALELDGFRFSMRPIRHDDGRIIGIDCVAIRRKL